MLILRVLLSAFTPIHTDLELHLFEPNPNTFERFGEFLDKHAALPPDVTARMTRVNVAVDEAVGYVQFTTGGKFTCFVLHCVIRIQAFLFTVA